MEQSSCGRRVDWNTDTRIVPLEKRAKAREGENGPGKKQVGVAEDRQTIWTQGEAQQMKKRPVLATDGNMEGEMLHTLIWLLDRGIILNHTYIEKGHIKNPKPVESVHFSTFMHATAGLLVDKRLRL